ncbi:MAG: hypothetical protein Q9183_000258 [Haloplaca sp. 2 TL-2023]
MFPRYDPSVALTQQSYYPRVEVNAGVLAVTRRLDSESPYSPSLQLQHEPPSQWSALASSNSGVGSGLGLQHIQEPTERPVVYTSISTPVELVDLWALANGQKSSESVNDFTLELSCDDLADGKEIICFDSSISQSLYKLSASDNELTVSRTHPTHDSTKIQVCAPALQTSNSPTALVVPIFPTLAELMAIDKSSTLAVEHGLDRKACADLQSEAIERAYRQEASSLLWDNESQRHYLIHPKLLEDESPAAFPIEVHSSSGSPREISILAPNSTTTIVSLSFETLYVVINAQAITAFSSLYLLDTLLSATLVLLLHLHRSRTSPPLRPTSPAFSLPAFEPPPTIPSPLRLTTRTQRRLTSWSKSFFGKPPSQSTEHKNKRKPREDDEESATTITVQGSPDPSMTAKLPHPPTNTLQLTDTRDERLPRTTRAVLRVLYWSFECLIWGLGVLVNILAIMVLGLAKLVKIL